MNERQEVNMIIGLHFDSVDNQKYQEIMGLVLRDNSLSEGSTVFAQVFDDKEAMSEALLLINPNDEA